MPEPDLTSADTEAERFARTLLQSGESFSNLLLALLRDPEASPELRTQACWLLQILEDKRAVPPLLKIAQDRHADAELRREATQALGLLRSKRSVLSLIEILLNGDDDEWVRRMAARSLGLLDDPRGGDALFRVIKDQTVPPEIRGDATEALTYFRDVRAVPMLP